MNEQTYVELKHIQKRFGDYVASDDVSFSIKKGELIGLLGPSGSGKTTILRILAGLETAENGEIYIDGTEVSHLPASTRGVGFVFQNYALFRYKTVYDNIAFGLKLAHRKPAQIKARVTELIELVGLTGLEKRYPQQLSGGQRQRVAFARALAPQPQLLLLDEPFAAIDAKIRQELRSWLKEMIARVGITSIFVTHDQDEAIEVADRIIITSRGKIEQIGTPAEIYRTPSTPFVAEFVGHSVTVGQAPQLHGFDAFPSDARVLFRPEFLTVKKETEPQHFPVSSESAVVESVSFRGDFVQLSLRIRGILLTARRGTDEAPVAVGETVRVFIRRLYLLSGGSVRTLDNAALLQQPVYI